MVSNSIFLKRCHGEDQASFLRWRGYIALHMSVDELVDQHVGKSVSPKLQSTTGERGLSRLASNCLH